MSNDNIKIILILFGVWRGLVICDEDQITMQFNNTHQTAEVLRIEREDSSTNETKIGAGMSLAKTGRSANNCERGQELKELPNGNLNCITVVIVPSGN